MAEPFDTLIQVQDHDTVLDQLRHRIETLPERLELRDVEGRRAALAVALAEVQGLVDGLTERQQALEEQIAATAKRRHDIEQRMLSGEVSASRDLQAMDHEAQQLAVRQTEFEEQELALLEEEEPLDALVDGHRAAMTALAEDALRLEAAVTEAEQQIAVSIAATETERATAASRLPPDLTGRYETLRSHFGGVGAARLVGDRCDGCHLTLPSVEIERIRRLPPDEVVTCAQCDRILVH